MKKTLLAAVSLLALTGAAIAQDQPGHKSPAPGSNNETMSAMEDATGALVGKISAEMTHTTQGFVTAAATSDMYEVEAGKIAAERAKSADVKAFAREMVKAHTATTTALKAILMKGKVNVTPPSAVDSRRQGMLDNLKGAKAEDFDHRYIVQQVAAHKEASALMEGYAHDGDNKAVQAFAAKTLPAVNKHLAMAEKMQAMNDKMKK